MRSISAAPRGARRRGARSEFCIASMLASCVCASAGMCVCVCCPLCMDIYTPDYWSAWGGAVLVGGAVLAVVRIHVPVNIILNIIFN